jgi:hypothetical protein
MPLNQRHLIDTQVFTIHFSDQEQTETEHDNGLTDFIKSRLLQVVDKVFNECCPDQTIISLDALELDLGTIPYQGYQDEMAERLQRDLTKLLKDRINQLPEKTQGGERKLTTGQGHLEILRYFLETGQLPWTVASEADPLASRLRSLLDNDTDALFSLLANLQYPQKALQRLVRQFSPDLVNKISNLAAAGKNEQQRKVTQLFAQAGVSSTAPDKQIRRFILLIQQALFANQLDPLRQNWLELIRQHPQLLHGEVIKYGQQSDVRRQIAHSFPDPMFSDLVQVLEPSEHGFIEEVVFRPSRPSSKEEGSSNDEMGEQQRLREFTLTYLLTERGSRFNKKIYLASLLRRIAAHDNVAASTVLASIRATLAAVPTQTRVQQEILQLLTEIQKNNELGPASVDTKEQEFKEQQEATKQKNNEQRFLQLLEQAFYEQLPAQLQSQWQVLIRQHTPLLHQQLMRHGQAASVRQRIASAFTDPMFADLLHLLEPTQSDFLAEVVFHSSLTSRKEQEPPGHDLRVREFTLAYLITERGSFFNKKSYLSSLLTRMAAHDNLDQAALIRSLADAFTQQHRPGSRVQQELVELLKELSRQESPGSPEYSKEAATLLRLQEQYQWLFEQICRPTGLVVQGVEQFSHILEELFTQSPSFLHRLFAECSDIILNRFFAEASKESMRILVTVLIRFTTRNQAGGGTELLQAVEHFVSQASSSRTYYRLLAEKIQANESIDFEQILEQSSKQQVKTTEVKRHAPQQPDLPRQQDSPGTILHPALVRLLILLKQQGVHKELIQATEHYATRAANLDTFCELILTCLHNDQPIDFEEILKKSTTTRAQVQESTPTGLAPDISKIKTGHQEIRSKELSLPATLAGIPLAQTEEQLIQLLNLKHLSQAEEHTLTALIQRMSQNSPARLRFLLEAGVAATPDQAERLATILPESQLSRIFLQLRPQDFLRLQQQAEQIALACYTGAFGATAATIQQLKRLFLSRYILEGKLGKEEFVLAFIRFLQVHLNAPDRRVFLRNLHQEILEQEPKPQPRSEVASILRRELAKKHLTVSGNMESKEAIIPQEQAPASPEEVFAEEIFLENSGLVLVATYLPRLFKMLGLLEHGEFISAEAAERAVHLLQYLVEERCDCPEYMLVLNKILCGLASDHVLIKEIAIGDEERQSIDGMLTAVIQHWGALGNTSVAGLREAFFQREGALRFEDDGWHLQVEEKAYDMLLDRLPWSFSLIKQPWMEHPLYVQWR